MDTENNRRFIKQLDIILKKQNFINMEYDIEDFTRGNLSKMIWNIEATVEKNGEPEILDLLVKSNHSETHDILKDAHLNEIKVYSKIVPCFNKFAEEHKTDRVKNVPYCYGVSSADQPHIVVLENLESKGFIAHHPAPLSMNHINLLLKAFANWHAFSFALRDQRPIVFDELRRQMLASKKNPMWNEVLNSYVQEMDWAIEECEGRELENEPFLEQEVFTSCSKEPIYLQKLKSLRKNFRLMFEEFMINYKEKYLAIIHAHAWDDNFMFKYVGTSTPSEVRIINWQTATIGSPVLDIAQILFFCCPREELEGMDDLLLLYYSTLSEKIRQLGSDPDKCFPRQACLESFRRYAPLAIAGVPHNVIRQFSDDFMGYKEASEDGDSSLISEYGISDTEKCFESMISILEICIKKNLI